MVIFILTIPLLEVSETTTPNHVRLGVWISDGVWNDYIGL